MSVCTVFISQCELYHWVDALDRFDEILEEAATGGGTPSEGSSSCIFMCPKLQDLQVPTEIISSSTLNFVAQIIHVYI